MIFFNEKYAGLVYQQGSSELMTMEVGVGVLHVTKLGREAERPRAGRHFKVPRWLPRLCPYLSSSAAGGIKYGRAKAAADCHTHLHRLHNFTPSIVHLDVL